MKKIFFILILFATCFSAVANDGFLRLTTYTTTAGWKIYIDGKKEDISFDVVNGKELDATYGEVLSVVLQLPEGYHSVKGVYDYDQWSEYRFIKGFYIEPEAFHRYHINFGTAIKIIKPSTIEHNRNLMVTQGWIDNGDGTATNIRTKLTWKRCYEGQSWTGSSCAGAPKGYTWEDAKKLKSNFAEKNDWRLPTLDELHSIVYCSSGHRNPIKKDTKGKTAYINGIYADGRCLGENIQSPTVNLAVFPMQNYKENMDDRYYPNWSWSSTDVSNNTYSAWFVFFLDGTDFSYPKETNLAVRLVRNQ